MISFDKDVRVETYPFARAAVREVFFNAFIHSKWQEGNPIQIKIRDMEMSIINSCSFPEGWTKDDLFKPQKSVHYNPDIANVFYKARYIEAWGRGIDKVFSACRGIGAKVPEYELGAGDITINDRLSKLIREGLLVSNGNKYDPGKTYELARK